MEQRAVTASELSALSGLCLRRVLGSIGALSAVVMIAAATVGQTSAATLAATIFALSAATVAVIFGRQTRGWARSGSAPLAPAFAALLQSSVFAAICYAWGTVAMQGLYLTAITGLKWQHGWQYALAMALLAGTSLAFARALSVSLRGATLTGTEWPFRLAAPLAAAQACVAGGGLIALAVSGKLFSMRADWAANRVFAALAVAIFAVSVVSIVTHRHLTAERHTA